MTLLAIVTTARLLHGARHRTTRCGTLRRVKKTSLYLDPDLDEALARRAADEGLTKAEFIRRTLAAAMQKPRRPKPQAIGLVDDGPDRRRAERGPVSARDRLRRVTRRRRQRLRRRSGATRADEDHGAARAWIATTDEDLVTTPLARRRDGLPRPRAPGRARAARAVVRPRPTAPTASAGGRTRWARRWPSLGAHPWLGLTDASLVALAGRLRTNRIAHLRRPLPITDYARRGTLRAAPRRRLKGP